MKFKIMDHKGVEISTLNAEESVFGIKPNSGAVRQAILSEMTNMRQGTHSAKNRSKVKGGGKKPWKQKGRGAARAGTIRSPLWKGGGTIFGPEPHAYNHKLPKKISKLARKSVLSAKAAEGSIVVIEEFLIDTAKTSEFVSLLKILNLANKKITLLVNNDDNINLDYSVRNLKNVHLVQSLNASTYDLIDCDCLIIDKNSIEILTKLLCD
tara:strand:+ start:975 stop:1604 length:630 start_codon:yes stop_codon:yes gene_type:complete